MKRRIVFKFRHSASLLIAVVVSFLLASQVAAMSSPNYRLDWYTTLTGGGGPMNSTNYQVNFTIGQSAVGAASSANYGLGMGYWTFSVLGYRVDLPLILR